MQFKDIKKQRQRLKVKSRFLIYALIDPFTKQVRYIGKSTSGLKRPKVHFCPSMLEPYGKNKNLTKKQSWVKSIINKGKKPLIKVLQYFTCEEQLDSAEIYYISQVPRICESFVL